MHINRPRAGRCVAPLVLALMFACSGTSAGPDAAEDARQDPGAQDIPIDTGIDASPDASHRDPGPDAPSDAAGDTEGSDPGTPDPGMSDPGPHDYGQADVPTLTCCISDAQCPAGWRCVPIPGHMGACKPRLASGMCWGSHDCGPERLCLGATPCRCDQTDEGDGCDIPGHCIDREPGCCGTDRDCPAGQDCAPDNVCRPRLQAGQCWTSADCTGIQSCVGASTCPCGFQCPDAPQPGRCDPLPLECCYEDDDCTQDSVCRARTPGDPSPGSCVADPSGSGCPFDASCCWEDGDCPGGWCEGAFSCGCISLCPTCGACPEDRIGQCRAWDIAVTFDPPAAGTCVTRPEYPAFSSFRLSLAWHTSVPAQTQLEVALNFFPTSLGYIPMDEGFLTDHAFDLSLTHFTFHRVPREGDRVLVRARATDGSGGKGLSDPVVIPLDAAAADCMYPYDARCSDGGPILCRALPPPCAPDLVLAAFAGCLRCVFPATCSCDDGRPLECLAAEPQCAPGQVAAIRQGCWTCANALTCLED